MPVSLDELRDRLGVIQGLRPGLSHDGTCAGAALLSVEAQLNMLGLLHCIVDVLVEVTTRLGYGTETAVVVAKGFNGELPADVGDPT